MENRVRKIRADLPTDVWRFCPGDRNPADLPSRGVASARKWETLKKQWMEGPDFIRGPESEWPIDKSANPKVIAEVESRQMSSNSQCVTVAGVNAESAAGVNSKPRIIHESHCLHVSHISKSKGWKENFQMRHPVERYVRIDKVVDIERFSSLGKLYRVSAYVIRFINNMKGKLAGEHGQADESTKSGSLKMDELKEVEIYWVKVSQLDLIKKSKQLNNTLGLCVSNGMIVCKGRLSNSNLPVEQIHPILIRGESHFARLLVAEAHYLTMHGGKRDTLTQVRSKFWITKAKRMVDDVIRKCTKCNRLEAKPLKSMESAPLPDFRVQCSYPFENSGVDYLGSILVRQVFDDDDKFHKVEVVVYTCAVTRAVHLDVVPDLSAAAFIRSLKRFIGRKGKPNIMISDNATCFKNEEVKSNAELLQMGVEWKFIVPASSWWGGFWERIVRMVKRVLHKVLFRAAINYEELLTVIVEIEGVINSRPLTYMFNEIEDVLTPSHLLLGRRLLSDKEKAWYDHNEEPDNAVLSRRMRYLQTISEHYWKRFKEEYLVELREQHIQGSDHTRTVELGEIVVIQGQKKRNFWRLGKVISLINGKDDKVRAVVLKTFDGKKNRYIRRPIEKLYPLEVRANAKVDKSEISAANDITNENELYADDTSDDRRPQREVANTGILIRRLMGQS